MKSTGRNVFCLLSIVCSFSFASAQSYESIQPEKDVLYGNSIVLAEGNNTIFIGGTTSSAFTGGLYAVDGQAINQVKYKELNHDWRPLQLSGSDHWSGNSVTWKIEAPEGFLFNSGTITFSGIVPSATGKILTLSVYSEYSNNGNGLGGYLPASGATLYNQDSHVAATGWGGDTWTVALPQGVSVAYVTISKPGGSDNYFASFGKSLTINGVTLNQIPEPAHVGSILGIVLFGWIGWTRFRSRS